MNVLKYLPNRGARMIEQVLKSAMANAEDKGVRHVGDLIVADAHGDGGPMFKRLMPRARGMAYMIRRRSCHVTIGLTDLESLLAGGPVADADVVAKCASTLALYKSSDEGASSSSTTSLRRSKKNRSAWA